MSKNSIFVSKFILKMENNNDNKKSGAQKVAGLLFVACLFLGMAGGWYFGDIKIGLFGGMGVGFLLMAVVYLSESRRR